MRRLALSVVLVACSHEVSPLAHPDSDDERLFQDAMIDYEAADFAAAQVKLDRLVDEFPGSRRHAEAWYLAGRCRYELGAFPEALATLMEMRAAHDESKYAVNAAYYTGRS